MLRPLGSQGRGVSDLGLRRAVGVTCEHFPRAGEVMPPLLGLLFTLPTLESAGVQPLAQPLQGWGLVELGISFPCNGV